MIDREKVIKGLDCCVNDLGECEVCPYDEGMGKFACGKNLYSDAFALLIAHEPVKPVPAINNDGDWLCGNCYQSVVGEEELDASGLVPVKFNFCPNCGRAVKWE